MKFDDTSTAGRHRPETGFQGEVLRCEVLRGVEALNWARSPANRVLWIGLYERCEWKHPFLSCDLFQLWLTHYGSMWEPLLVLGRDSREALKALMPLAMSKGLITGIGAHQAEYQGWLGGRAEAAQFVVDALKLLGERMSARRIHLKYLSAAMPLDTVREALRGSARVSIVEHRTPLLALDKSAILASLQKKSTKSKVNRLQREGTLSFDAGSLAAWPAEVFDKVISLYDFRQGAAHNARPFLEDPHKRAFHLDWMRQFPKLLDLTLTRLDEEIIGAYFAVNSGPMSHVAIVAYSPFHARHSPGKLHIYNTALALAERGRAWIDLTPGGDAWKERFATSHAAALELTVYLRAADALRSRAAQASRRSAHALLAIFRISPGGLRLAARRAIALVRRVIDKFRLRGMVAARATHCLYQVGLESVGAVEYGACPKANCLDDLVRFTSCGDRRDAQTYLGQALARLEAGGKCYTLADAEGLRFCAWACSTSQSDLLAEFSLPQKFPRTGTVLYDVVTGPRGRPFEHCAELIHVILSDLKRAGKSGAVYAWVRADDLQWRRMLERLGFERDPR